VACCGDQIAHGNRKQVLPCCYLCSFAPLLVKETNARQVHKLGIKAGRVANCAMRGWAGLSRNRASFFLLALSAAAAALIREPPRIRPKRKAVSFRFCLALDFVIAQHDARGDAIGQKAFRAAEFTLSGRALGERPGL
jgi:hypothetical protein